MTLYPSARFCDILDNAHNLPLHLAVELGLPAALLLCGTALWLTLQRKPWREADISFETQGRLVKVGVAVGDTVAQQLFGDPQIARAVSLPPWTELIALVTMPLAFTVLLRAHWRDAVWIVIAGALAVGGAKLGVRLLGPELGVFLGALTVGVASNWYSRLMDHPAIITQVPGILLLVPGSVGFRGLAALLDRQIVSGVDTTFKMILTAMALVAGTLIANIVVPSRREL